MHELADKDLADPEHSRLVLVEAAQPVLLGQRIPQGLLDRGDIHEKCGPLRAALVAECCACIRSLNLNLHGQFASAVVQAVLSDSLDVIRFLDGRSALDVLMLLWDVFDSGARPARPSDPVDREVESTNGRPKVPNEFIEAVPRELVLQLCDRISLLWQNQSPRTSQHQSEAAIAAVAQLLPSPPTKRPQLTFQDFHKWIGILFHGDPSARLLVQCASSWFDHSSNEHSVESSVGLMIAVFDSSREVRQLIEGGSADRVGGIGEPMISGDSSGLVMDIVDVVRLFNATLGDSLNRSQQADPAGEEKGMAQGEGRTKATTIDVQRKQQIGRQNIASFGAFLVGVALSQVFSSRRLRGNHLLTLAAGALKFSASSPRLKVALKTGNLPQPDVMTILRLLPSSSTLPSFSGPTVPAEIKLSLKDASSILRGMVFLRANSNAARWLKTNGMQISPAAAAAAKADLSLTALRTCLEKHSNNSDKTSSASLSLFSLFDFRFGSSFSMLGNCFHGIIAGAEGSSFQIVEKNIFFLVQRSRSLLEACELKTLLTMTKFLRDEFSGGIDLSEEARSTMTVMTIEICNQLMQRRCFDRDHGAIVSVSITIATHALSTCSEYLSLITLMSNSYLKKLSHQDPAEALKLVALISTAVACTRGTAAIEEQARECLVLLTKSSICEHWKQFYTSRAKSLCKSNAAPCVRCMPMWQNGKYAVWLLKAHALLGVLPTAELLESICGSAASSSRVLERRPSSCSIDSALVLNGETRLFDLARSVTNLHASLCMLRADEQGEQPKVPAASVRLTSLILQNIVNDTLLVHVIHMLQSAVVPSSPRRSLGDHHHHLLEKVKRDVYRAVSQCVATFICDPVVLAEPDLTDSVDDSASKIVKMLELLSTASNLVLNQASLALDVANSSPSVARSRSSSLSGVESLAKILSQFVLLALSVEFMMSKSARLEVLPPWKALQPQLSETLRRCLEARSSSAAGAGGRRGGYVLSREKLAEIANHLPFPIGLVEDPGPLCSVFAEISVSRMMGG